MNEDKAVEEQSTPLVLEKLEADHNDALLAKAEMRGTTVVTVRKEAAYEVLAYLKTEPELAYTFLVDVTAVDNSEMESELVAFEYARFMVIYHLYSHKEGCGRVRVKVPVHENDLNVASVTGLWKGANWLERETYDMFGINFEGHPNLRRLLTPDDFEGHPLRKDYPLRGRGEREAFNFDKQNV